MDDTNSPNPASAKAKAEGERDESAGGITNRPLSEEEENQAVVHGRSIHAVGQDDDLIARNSEEARATPRRYDRPVEDENAAAPDDHADVKR